MDQKTALGILKSGKNVFLTGSAGSGKTYTLRQFILHLREQRVPVAVTASTGIAATHMNGTTVHAWSGIGIRDVMSRKDLEDLKKKKNFRQSIEKTAVLIIDEISMLHANQLNAVQHVLRSMRNSSDPFGGIQVVFCGDFFQLPPVGKREEANRDKFAFMSQAWLDAGLTICYLTEQHRQNDGPLNRILNEIREGQPTDWTIQQLRGASLNAIEVEDPPKLFTHNVDVDRINQEQLRALSGQPRTYEAVTKGRKNTLETLKKSVLAEEFLQVKDGARVMFIKNLYEKRVMNGTLGIIKGFQDTGDPIVETTDGRTIYTEPETWSVENAKGKTVASFEQLPLRLAWAITVHKSQGMTLDAAEIDLSKTFERGQGYVALSRLRDMTGLRLTGFNQRALEVDELVTRADRRFRELSDITESGINMEDLEAQERMFVLKFGSAEEEATEEDEEEKPRRKKKKTKAKKGATYEITKGLIEQGKSMDEIAVERGLARSTILSHVMHLRELDPELDLAHLKPPAALMQQIEDAYISAGTDPNASEGSPGLKTLFEALGGNVTYDDIRLALLFLDH
ncbi:MAG: AAA family ATPase [Flavobacteriales bacterium]|nr:AAA family ATPase [Flavobacteriales bacterium]